MPGDTSVLIHAIDSMPVRDSAGIFRAAAVPANQPDNSLWFFLVIAAFVVIIGAAFFINRLLQKNLQKQANPLKEN